jgi:uncharacterized membrane protein
MSKRITRSLDLNSEQQLALDQLLAEVGALRSDMLSQTDLTPEVLSDLIARERVDPQDLNARIASQENRVIAFRNAAVQQFVDFHASLDPDQRAKLAHHIARHEGKRARR